MQQETISIVACAARPGVSDTECIRSDVHVDKQIPNDGEYAE